MWLARMSAHKPPVHSSQSEDDLPHHVTLVFDEQQKRRDGDAGEEHEEGAGRLLEGDGVGRAQRPRPRVARGLRPVARDPLLDQASLDHHPDSGNKCGMLAQTSNVGGFGKVRKMCCSHLSGQGVCVRVCAMGVVNLALQVAVVNLTPPVGVVNLAPSWCGETSQCGGPDLTSWFGGSHQLVWWVQASLFGVVNLTSCSKSGSTSWCGVWPHQLMW